MENHFLVIVVSGTFYFRANSFFWCMFNIQSDSTFPTCKNKNYFIEYVVNTYTFLPFFGVREDFILTNNSILNLHLYLQVVMFSVKFTSLYVEISLCTVCCPFSEVLLLLKILNTKYKWTLQNINEHCKLHMIWHKVK